MRAARRGGAILLAGKFQARFGVKTNEESQRKRRAPPFRTESTSCNLFQVACCRPNVHMIPCLYRLLVIVSLSSLATTSQQEERTRFPLPSPPNSTSQQLAQHSQGIISLARDCSRQLPGRAALVLSPTSSSKLTTIARHYNSNERATHLLASNWLPIAHNKTRHMSPANLLSQ